MRSQPVLCRAVVEVSRRLASRAGAAVEVRSMRVTLVPDPRISARLADDLDLVEVWEPAPAGTGSTLAALDARAGRDGGRGAEVVRNTLSVADEEVHLVLKSGCKVEDLRLETWDRLEKAVRVDAAVAARIVLLRDLGEPEARAEVLSEDEVEVLVCRFGKGMKPSELTIGQAVLWIGLGGHLNRKRDGMPGVRTLWRGLRLTGGERRGGPSGMGMNGRSHVDDYKRVLKP